jgi:Protein of unknown function (DUF2599)
MAVAASSASPGATVSLSGVHLQPGAHVSIAVVPQGRSGVNGIAIGAVRVVPQSGRLHARFRWPGAYYHCYRTSGACAKANWSHNGRARIYLTAPDLVAKTYVAASAMVNVRGRRTSHRVAAVAAVRAPQATLPGGTKCSSTWFSYAKVSGEGYGAKVSVLPNTVARLLGRVWPDSLREMWNDLNACVQLPQVSAAATNTLQEQLACHIELGISQGETGPTWDFEAWRQDVGNGFGFLSNRCNYPTSDAAKSAYAGYIVQWSDDPNAQKTAWLVVPGSNGGYVRNWIPTSDIYFCLKNRGAPGPVVLNGDYLDDVLPDQIGTHAGCDTPAPPAPMPTPPPPDNNPAPSPGPPTVAETTGGVTHTWTNYTNGGGIEGPTIPGGTTVAIACKLTGLRVQDGNTWWYRIATSPWNGAYYASADAFYNNGQTSGTLVGTPYVDPAVPDC